VIAVRLRWRRLALIRDDWEPIVDIVIPMYNEGSGIHDTIVSLMEQDYPQDRLHVTVVDDCSRDDSYSWACKAAGRFKGQVTVLRNLTNEGKRRGINQAVRHSRAEIIVSVDSDVIVDRRAVRNLVRRFVDPRIAAVGGRVNVLNADENWLTRMQTIKYFFSYQYLKNLERAFGCVMCLSGCLTAYRRSVLLALEPILESRSVCGVPIKYGEDRYLTRQIVRAGHQTTTTLDANCWTVAPNTVAKYFAQQLRWRRSNVVDFLLGMTHAWRMHPIITLHYLSLFALLACYPVVIWQSLMDGTFWSLAAEHCLVVGGFAVLYGLQAERVEGTPRVNPVWFLCMVFVMPVTYLLFTPLALFTLDSSNWETRKHVTTPNLSRELTAPAAAAAATLE
jgi:cellulose synthase/poly-beta-1,6-N-acetylglucosamine synthase-like glycosyltransferase